MVLPLFPTPVSLPDVGVHLRGHLIPSQTPDLGKNQRGCGWTGNASEICTWADAPLCEDEMDPWMEIFSEWFLYEMGQHISLKDFKK